MYEDFDTYKHAWKLEKIDVYAYRYEGFDIQTTDQTIRLIIF